MKREKQEKKGWLKNRQRVKKTENEQLVQGNTEDTDLQEDEHWTLCDEC